MASVPDRCRPPLTLAGCAATLLHRSQRVPSRTQPNRRVGNHWDHSCVARCIRPHDSCADFILAVPLSNTNSQATSPIHAIHNRTDLRSYQTIHALGCMAIRKFLARNTSSHITDSSTAQKVSWGVDLRHQTSQNVLLFPSRRS